MVKKILIQKLKLHTDEPEKLLDSIDQAGGCISGSFILAALYDQNFYHDIDIYENPNIAIPQDLYNMNYLHKICKICKYMRHSFDCDHDYWYSGNMFNELNYKIRSFLPAEYGNGYYLPFDFLIVSNHGIFQHMAIPFHIPTFIAKSFDLDLCKNMYY